MRSFKVCECGAPLTLIEAPTPQPVGSQVLLKVLAAGVCHSDIHIWNGYYELGGGKRLQHGSRKPGGPPVPSNATLARLSFVASTRGPARTSS